MGIRTQDPGEKNTHQLNNDRLAAQGSGFATNKDKANHVQLQSTEAMSPTTYQNKANALFDGPLSNDRDAAKALKASKQQKKKT